MKRLSLILLTLFTVTNIVLAEVKPITQVTKDKVIYNLYDDGHAGVVGPNSDKELLKEVRILDEIKHKGKLYTVSEIESSAFENRIIENIYLPSHPLEVFHSHSFANATFAMESVSFDVDSIGSNAMFGIKIQDGQRKQPGQLNLGAHFRTFAPDAFSYILGFRNFNVHPDNPFYSSQSGMLMSKNHDTLYRAPEFNEVFKKSDYNASSRKYHFVPKGIVRLNQYALSDYWTSQTDDNSINSFVLQPEVRSIGKNSLSHSDYYEIICLSHVPPAVTDSIISESDFKIQVPLKAIEAYKNADGWKDAKSITPIVDTKFLAMIDQPVYSTNDFDPYNLASLEAAYKDGNPYAAYHLADYAHKRWRYTSDYEVREGWLEEYKKWLTSALNGLQNVQYPEDNTIYNFYLGQVWQDISNPTIAGGAFENDDDLFEESFGNALRYYTEAGENGYAPAYRKLGEMWLYGWPTGGSGGYMINDDYAPDFEKGKEFMILADKLGDKNALVNLGAYIYNFQEDPIGKELICKNGSEATDLFSVSTYLSHMVNNLSPDQLEQIFGRLPSWNFEKYSEFANILLESNDPELQLAGARIWRNGPYQIISLEKALNSYKKIFNNPNASDEQKAMILWKIGELEFWQNPGEGSEDIKSFKILATNPLYQKSGYSDMAKGWLGWYYSEVQMNNAESQKWFSRMNRKQMEDRFNLEALYLLYSCSPKSSDNTYALNTLKDRCLELKNQWYPTYYYVNTIAYYGNSDNEKRELAGIKERIINEKAYQTNPHAELILIRLCKEYDELKDFYEDSFSPIPKATYGRYLIDSEKNIALGISLLEQASEEIGNYVTSEEYRTANYSCDYVVERHVWMAYLAQLYGQDGEEWGSDYLNLPQSTYKFRNPTKAKRWKEACHEIDWNGPSGW